MVDNNSSLVNEGRNTLVVLLHAYQHHAANLAPVENAVVGIWPNAKVHRPELPASTFSMVDPNLIVAKRLAEIDRIVGEAEKEGTPFENIILVGHSLGALLARKLYVVACGQVPGAPLEPVFSNQAKSTGIPIAEPRAWAARVSRIVLLAGMNRGWRISHHLNPKHAPFWWLGSGLCHVIHMFRGRWPLIFTIRRGAEFITQLRIQWLLMRRRAGAPQSSDPQAETSSSCPGNALTIQLLGSRDDMVAPEDNVDLVSGGDFIYRDVPYSGHADVIEMDDPTYGPGRKTVFLDALTASPETLQRNSVVPSDDNFLAPDYQVTKMVYVIHGIRDVGYWTHKIARRVKQRATSGATKWATETSSYGYFPMFPFLFPWYRRQKVEWLMDQYTEALARYPNATFSYVGHSNGTYLLAKALELYPCCYFDNVVFAGSVVNRQYKWEPLLAAERVKAVLNFVATSDWVVAFFPKLFQFPRLQDLGSAGHDGFTVAQSSQKLYEVKYVKGGHGAAIEEPVWDVIAEFVVTGQTDTTTVPGTALSRSIWVSLPGRFPLVVWLFIGGIAWAIWLGVEHLIGITIADPLSQAYTSGFAMAAYVVVLWLVLMRG